MTTPEAAQFIARAHVSRGKWAPELDGKVAIITGAGRLRSIGRAIALELARQGVHCVLTGTGRDPSSYPPDEQEVAWRDIESVAEEVQSIGPRALPIVASVADEHETIQTIERTVAAFGHVDILVNNAGAARAEDRKPVVDVPLDAFRKVMDVNLTGTYLMSRGVARQLIAQGAGGRIVNISSIASKAAGANQATYAATKAGIDAFGHAMALELARYNITVNTINPGLIETARMDDMGRGETWAAAQARIPMGYASDGMDIAYFATYLCTDMAKWITGQTINVDGGQVWH